MKKEVAVGTVIQYAHRSNNDHTPRWERTQRAQLFDQYLALQAQGRSLRQAAKALAVPRSTLQAWRSYQESLDEHPAVVAFFQSAPGLAFLHRLVLGIHLVCTEVGACGIRLVCLLLKLTGLDRFVAASYGAQHQVNRQVEEAIVRYRQDESARLAKDMPAKDITLAKDETFTGGLCLVAMEPKSNYIVLEQAAQGRDHDTWNTLMEKALSGFNCQVIQSTSDQHRAFWPPWSITSARTTRRTSSMCSMSWSKPSAVPWPPSSGQLPRRPARRKSGSRKPKNNFWKRLMRLPSAAQVALHKQPHAWSNSNRTRKRRARSSSASAPSASRSPRASVTSVRPTTLSI